jgi:uncharacterized membrane protein YfcA
MHLDLPITVGSLIVGFIVGLTGMGGGALMTPMLVLLFGVPAPAAVSSDLVASLVMRPLGAVVHLRRRTVQGRMALWLCIGSVPSAFVGVLLLKLLAHGGNLESIVQYALGAALLLAVGGMVLKALLNLRQRARGEHLTAGPPERLLVRPLPTLLVGALGGLVVGMTSVGAGTIIIVLLLFLYPRLTASQLVGTDLLQAIPLVGSAALAHLLFGDARLALSLSLIAGGVPGVFVGAQVSSLAPPRLVRRALTLVLLASGLKLVQVGSLQLAAIILAGGVVGPLLWMLVRRTDGLMVRRPRAGSAA